MRLATFVHISDLHFGDVDGDGAPTHSAAARAILSKFRVFDGLFGHSRTAIYRLVEFWERILKDEENVQLVVTGDLTAYGSEDQFRSALTYVENEVTPPYGNNIGLHAWDWRERSIPGNHDQWPGYPIIFGRGYNVANHFPGPPFVQPKRLPNGLTLRILAIDTDADVWPFGRNRLYPRGRFTSQLIALNKLIEPPKQDEFTVLLLHHSPSHVGKTLGIVPGSLGDLSAFLIEQHVAVMLCGHVHVPRVSTYRAQDQGRVLDVLEACCGTTTQLDRLPLGWRDFSGRRPDRRLTANTLLVHRLDEQNNEVLWSIQAYSRDVPGFSPEASIPPVTVRVWP